MKNTLALVLMVLGIVGCAQDSSKAECIYQKSLKCKTNICANAAIKACEVKYNKPIIKECKKLQSKLQSIREKKSKKEWCNLIENGYFDKDYGYDEGICGSRGGLKLSRYPYPVPIRNKDLLEYNQNECSRLSTP
ncbi:hypothetical protein OAB49_02655 [Gammaproteobacteria bacterium]|nr:hypothetical protein [Gammaproteobacteria bacterium]